VEEKIQQLLHLVDSKYPAQLDEGLTEQLNAAKKRKGHGSREDVFGFVSLTFKGTRHQAVGGSDTTLYLSLQHPHVDVRLAALKTVRELLEEDSIEPEVRLSLQTQQLFISSKSFYRSWKKLFWRGWLTTHMKSSMRFFEFLRWWLTPILPSCLRSFSPFSLVCLSSSIGFQGIG